MRAPPLGTRAQQLAWAARAAGGGGRARRRRARRGYHGWRCLCAGGCGAACCSLACRAEDWGAGGHELVCAGPHDEAHPLVELERAARESHESFGAAAAALSAAAAAADHETAVARLGALRRPTVPWWELQAVGMAPKRARRVVAECRAQAAEAHAMFRVGMMYEGGVDEGSAALAQDAWVGVLGALETARVPLSLPPPALGHCIERLAAIERGEAPKGDAERLAAVLDAVVRVAAEAPAADGASRSDSDSDDYASSDYDDASDIKGDVETTAAGADATGGADGGSAAGVGAAGTAGAYQARG